MNRRGSSPQFNMARTRPSFLLKQGNKDRAFHAFFTSRISRLVLQIGVKKDFHSSRAGSVVVVRPVGGATAAATHNALPHVFRPTPLPSRVYSLPPWHCQATIEGWKWVGGCMNRSTEYEIRSLNIKHYCLFVVLRVLYMQDR